MAVFLLIGKTSALTMNVAGVVKDWLLILLSVVLYGWVCRPAEASALLQHMGFQYPVKRHVRIELDVRCTDTSSSTQETELALNDLCTQVTSHQPSTLWIWPCLCWRVLLQLQVSASGNRT
jgi:hypothetical protein